MQYGISILLSGISLGGQYALIAIGYTMVYGILRLINFAHGDVFMAAGLIMVYLSASLPIGVALPLMILLTVLLGFVIERAAYKPLRSAPRMSVMISAIGVSYLLQNLATYITGGLPQMYPSLPGLSSQITIAGTSTKMVTVITPFLVVALVVVLTQLINHTKIGMAMRAASRDFETAQLMGIKINNIISFTFVIGSFLAAVGSALYFTNYPSIVPLSGSLPGLRAFSAIGVSYLLQNLATYITGGLPQMYPSLPGLSSQITIAGTSTKMVTVITPFLVVALVVVLTQLINHTKIGMAMRAASRDFETAQLMGIKINNIISFTFVIGSFLAAVGSALYFTNYPSIVPLSGSLPGLRAFVAAVFGGIGSIPGAVVGAFLIGLSETVIKSSNWSVFSDAFTFALLIIILVVKPTGLFGEKSTDKV